MCVYTSLINKLLLQLDASIYSIIALSSQPLFLSEETLFSSLQQNTMKGRKGEIKKWYADEPCWYLLFLFSNYLFSTLMDKKKNLKPLYSEFRRRQRCLLACLKIFNIPRHVCSILYAVCIIFSVSKTQSLWKVTCVYRYAINVSSEIVLQTHMWAVSTAYPDWIGVKYSIVIF